MDHFPSDVILNPNRKAVNGPAPSRKTFLRNHLHFVMYPQGYCQAGPSREPNQGPARRVRRAGKAVILAEFVVLSACAPRHA